MSSTRLAAISTFAAATVLLAASLLYGRIIDAADPGSMEAMSIDMDTTGNTATSLGPRDECVIAAPGATVTIDVTATNIPAAYPMLAFAFTLNFPAGVITVESADSSFLLASGPGSSILDVSDPVPDGDGVWNAAVLDFGDSHESGSGVLDRITLSLAPGAPAGVYPIELGFPGHVDPATGNGHGPAVVNNAFVAVNATCDNLPTPTPTPSPTPTPPLAPNGDFADAVVIGELPFWDAVSTAAASTEPGEPSPCGSIGATVWYAFTPGEDALLYAHTDGSDFDTVLAAYAGDSVTGLSFLDCNDDAGFGPDSALEFIAPAGQTIWFQVGGAGGATGTLSFSLEVLVPAPTPTPTPSPTPPPPFGFLVGDVDCNSAVNLVDSLKIVRFEVGLPVSQNEPCPDLGDSSLGDVDCDGYTNPRDALGIDRFVGELIPLSSTPGCPPIGTGTSGAPNPVPDGGTPTPGPNGYVVSVTSAVAEPGGQATVILHLSAPPPGMGAYSIDVVFDPSLVAATTCSILGPITGACNPVFAPGRVRVAGVTVSGQTGEVDLATITFQAGNALGATSQMPQASLMLDPDGSPRSTTVIPGLLTITPAPVPTPSPSPVPGAPPPFDPGGVICFENLESAAECDGETAPGAAADIRSKHCVGWSPDCSLKDSPVFDSNFGGFVSFTPPEWNVPAGNTVPIGAIAGRIDAEATLGILNNACNSRIFVEFTMLNASTNTGSLIPTGLTGDPMAPLARDANGNGIPDGADSYPAFLGNLVSGAQPRARLFGITHVQGSWITVNTLVFNPGAGLTIGSTPLTFNAALGYPTVTILQDPTAQAGPGWITDFCAPFFAQDVVLGKTINNPCAPVRVAGANCPVTTNVFPEIREHGYPAFPCDTRTTFDDDGDGTVNDGCPQYGVTAETGAECNNAVSDDSEDSHVNDGCPQVGDVSEGARIPGSCSGADEGGCTQRSNPTSGGTVNFTTLDVSQRDTDGDGIENSLDVCALVPNGNWNPRATDAVNDPDNDGLPTACDPNPSQPGLGSPVGCRSGYTGSDQDQDCFSNRADNCPNNTQLENPGLPPEYNTNEPYAPDQDGDGIGDACDPNPAAPNGNLRALCLKFALNVGGVAGPAIGIVDPTPGPQCAAGSAGGTPPAATATLPPAPAPSRTPTPTPTPTPTATPTPTPTPPPPIDLGIEIDDTGTVGSRGAATVYGRVSCSVPSFVDLTIELVQRSGKKTIEGTAEVSVWCEGHEDWKAKVDPEEREFHPGHATASVHASADFGQQTGEEDESERVHLKASHHKERHCDSGRDVTARGRRCRSIPD